MRTIRRQRRAGTAPGRLAVVLLIAGLAALAPPPETRALWPRSGKPGHHACGHPGCAPDRCFSPAGFAGAWYWMRSPDQEQRVVMGLYNRYCIRCHGIDGRGVWDIPDVPDFTDPRWQSSRPDPQIVNILMEGRGAVMPSFRGTLTLEESCAIAHYLRTFIPGTEVPRPETGRAAPPNPAPPNPAPAAGAPAAPRPAGTAATAPPRRPAAAPRDRAIEATARTSSRRPGP